MFLFHTRRWDRSGKIAAAGIIFILILRLIFHITLYKDGFIAISADDFGRIIHAALWSENPFWENQGAWLPAQMYFFGTIFRISKEYLWIPRILTIITGLIATIVVYKISWKFSNSHIASLVSALLFSLVPAGIWLSSTPLTELYYTALILTVFLFLLNYYADRRARWLVFSGILLGFANGLRFESWIVSAIFCIFVFIFEVACKIRDFWRLGKHNFWKTFHPAVFLALIIPWFFPATWIVTDLMENGQVLSYMQWIESYKTMTYGAGGSLRNFILPVQKADPLGYMIAPVAALFCIIRFRRLRAFQFWAIVMVIPLLLFLFIHKGANEPFPNYLRYITPFLLFFYPCVGIFIVELLAFLFHARTVQWAVLIAIIGVFCVVQIGGIFDYANGGAANGVAVGLKLREMRNTDPDLKGKPALIQLHGWEFLAIEVGAGDVTTTYLDRQPLGIRAKNPSWLVEKPEEVDDCIANKQFQFVIVRDPKLKQILEKNYGMLSEVEVNQYSFYRVPQLMLQNTSFEPCSWPFQWK